MKGLQSNFIAKRGFQVLSGFSNSPWPVERQSDVWEAFTLDMSIKRVIEHVEKQSYADEAETTNAVRTTGENQINRLSI